MSDEKLPTVIEDAVSDMTEKDLELVQKFKDEGLPNIATVDAEKMERMMSLYLSGKPYTQISMVMNISKSMVLYLSDRYQWFELKKAYITELESISRARLAEFNLVNQDFLLQLAHMFQKKIGSKVTKYLATDNEAFANSVDPKDVDKYLKVVDTLQRTISGKNPPPSAPAVGLNLGDGVTIVKKGDNEVEITPKSRVIGDILKEFADSRREEEKKK
jgi:hypothetical protein